MCFGILQFSHKKKKIFGIFHEQQFDDTIVLCVVQKYYSYVMSDFNKLTSVL